jgi:hypothetical protein
VIEMGTRQNKPTDLQRAVMQVAGHPDPDRRIVGAQHAQAAELLAERGYVVLHPHGDGFRVELSDWAARNYGCRTWRRLPQLGARAKNGVTIVPCA